MGEIMTAVKPLIRMINITKRFPGVVANDKVNLDLYPGQIHALLGENGSGKSTLMSILTGLYKPTEGSIEVNGVETKIESPSDAIAHGIGMVHQHFKLINTFTVAENIALSQSGGSFMLKPEEIAAEIGKFGEKYGLYVDPKAYIWQLSVGEKQRVEILRMLYHDSKILILDEPTAVLTPQETRELFINLRRMADDGCAVVFISHKLNEVLELADQVTVLRSGVVTGSIGKAEMERHKLIKMMIGRDVINTYEKSAANIGDVVLEIKGVSAYNDMHVKGLKDISFNVRGGEIYGIAGVSGNGQKELAEVIAGLRTAMLGSIKFHGEEIANMLPDELIARGISLVPEDRLGMGMVPNLNAVDNVILKGYDSPKYGKGHFIDKVAAIKATENIVKEFNIKMSSIYQPVKLMSGGNIQKLLLGREINNDPKLMVVLYPVRGLDIGAIEEVHKLLLELRSKGTSIILISEDLDELAQLADRVGVIFDGKILGEFPANQMDTEKIGALMAGVTDMEGGPHHEN
jgi:ABC-type uncharacterized transport system ATPase subunit